jgi:hypothetical protein
MSDKYDHLPKLWNNINHAREEMSGSGIHCHPIKFTINAIREAKRAFPTSHILVNAVSTSVADRALRDRLNYTNDALYDICHILPNVTFVDSSRLGLRDNIHYTKRSVTQLAGIIQRYI